MQRKTHLEIVFCSFFILLFFRGVSTCDLISTVHESRDVSLVNLVDIIVNTLEKSSEFSQVFLTRRKV